MRFAVRIFVETSYKGPARRDGAAVWLVEYMKNGVPVTREGMIRTEKGTENQAVLEALTQAVGILNKPCSIRVFTQCRHVLTAAGNGWCRKWQQDGWINSRGKPVKNADLWRELLEETGRHNVRFETGPHEYQKLMQDKVKKEMEQWKKREG